MSRIPTIITAAACLAVAGLAAAHAGPIPLVNGDFNTVYRPSTTDTAYAMSAYTGAIGSNVPVLDGLGLAYYENEPTTSAAVDIPGWVSAGGNRVGIQFTGYGQFNAYANGGAYGSTGGTITQTLTGVTAQANTVYTLAADLAANDYQGCPVTYQLWFGTTSLAASGSYIWVPDGDNSGTFSAQFVTGTVAPTGDLKITFSFGEYIYGDWHGATQSKLDNVALSFTPVPEPAALSLLGLGALGCLGRGRRRG